jgi:hypothetical protein
MPGAAADIGLAKVAKLPAKVAKLVDALDLGSSGATHESSSLSFRTINYLLSNAVDSRRNCHAVRAPRIFSSQVLRTIHAGFN